MIAQTGALRLVPVTQAEAKAFVAQHHRHNEAPLSSVFQVGVQDAAGALVGVAVAGRPKARMADDGETLEVNRTCVLEGNRNANSMLYGACARAARALGWKRLITYTLPEESGSSLRAVGWAPVPVGDSGAWEDRARKNSFQSDLYGARRMPTGPKIRWEVTL